MTRPTCKTCPYGEQEDEHQTELVCVRYPPKPQRDHDGCNSLGQYPLVPPSWTCGEHPDFPNYIAAMKPAR